MALPGLYNCFQHWGNRNAVWAISDTHFGDKDIQKAFPNRPSDEELIKNINQKVGKNGTLLLLGDVGDIECAKQLKGYKVLICGNHDAGAANYKEIFDEVYTGALIIGEKLLLSHEPIDAQWIFNLHGHNHTGAKTDKYHLNVCADVIGYTPINFNQFLKSGALSKIQTIRRTVIDKATERKKKRGGHKIGEK